VSLNGEVTYFPAPEEQDFSPETHLSACLVRCYEGTDNTVSTKHRTQTNMDEILQKLTLQYKPKRQPDIEKH
jgi:hypothetical protein